MSKTKSARVCAHCGMPGGATDDHIPPQNLYPKESREPNQRLHSVPACRACNNSASTDDEVFKAMILSEAGANHYSQKHALDSLAGTLSQNRRLWQYFEKSIEVYMPGADGLLPRQKVTFPREPYFKVLERIVRGLYWRVFGRPLGIGTSVSVLPRELQNDQWELIRSVWSSMTWGTLNGETFSFGYVEADDGSTIWAMWFFKSVLAYAIAEPPEHPLQLAQGESA